MMWRAGPQPCCCVCWWLSWARAAGWQGHISFLVPRSWQCRWHCSAANPRKVCGKLVRAGLSCGCKTGIDTEPPAITATDLCEWQPAPGVTGSKHISESFKWAVLWKGMAVFCSLQPPAVILVVRVCVPCFDTGRERGAASPSAAPPFYGTRVWWGKAQH